MSGCCVFFWAEVSHVRRAIIPVLTFIVLTLGIVLAMEEVYPALWSAGIGCELAAGNAF